MSRKNTSTSRRQLKVFKIFCAVLATFILFSVECSAYVIKQNDISATSKATDNKRDEATTERQYPDVDTIATKPGGDLLGLLSLTTGLRASAKRDTSNVDATLSVDRSGVQTSAGVNEIGTRATTEKEEDQATECKTHSDDQLLLRLSRQASGRSQRASSGNNNYIYPVNETCPQIVLDNFNNKSSLRFRSTCPYDEKRDVDYTRYPIELKYVQCYCRTGITMNGSTAVFSSDYTCRQEFYNVPVLRRGGCVDGVYEWTYDEERLPLACVTVVLPRVN